MSIIRILAIGDVVGKPGTEYIRNNLQSIKKEYEVDVVIANGENSAVGNGILPGSAEHLFDSGVDIITTGNHVYRRREIYQALEEMPYLIRPANYPAGGYGKGYCVYDGGSFQLAVINLEGTVYLDSLESPFKTADAILKELDTPIILVDFHAEATSEKGALAYYLDGRVSGVFGTHTHVQTADEQILPGGTGFITDIGMTGPQHSILGVSPEPVIQRFLTHLPVRFETADGPCKFNAVLFSVDKKSGKCVTIDRISK